MKYNNIISVIVLILLLGSCKEETTLDTTGEPGVVDIQNEMIGEYNYIRTDYFYDDGTEDIDSGNVYIDIGIQGDSSFIMGNDGNHIFYGNVLAKVGNEYGLGIENFIIADGPDGTDTLSFVSYDFIELNGVSYNGNFNYITKKLYMGFDIYIDDIKTFHMGFILTKI